MRNNKNYLLYKVLRLQDSNLGFQPYEGCDVGHWSKPQYIKKGNNAKPLERDINNIDMD